MNPLQDLMTTLFLIVGLLVVLALFESYLDKKLPPK